MDQIEHVLEHVFSLTNGTAFFPIRHHSPACSFHVKRAIALYQPDCVLIEGPCDTDPLIPCMAEAAPPVSVYYSYKDDEGRHACYYPLLEYSPELVALKTAREANIPVHFIDLPYGNLVLGERKLGRQEDSSARKAYYDDYFLQKSKYIERLCEKENCRDYSELWEKLFELPAAQTDTEAFIKNMTTLCWFSREDYPTKLLEEEQNPAREAFMAENILKHQKKYQRILVVTGGFHTARLMELVKTGEFEKQKPVRGSAYLIAYSFAECDQLSGYESGMPYPGYYQSAYESLRDGQAESYQTTTLTYITRLAKALRKNRESISLSEESAAFAMCLGLAQMRGKNQCGVYELLDGVRTAFVKGELNLATSFVLREARTLLRGEKIGQVGEGAPQPPIVLDFEEKAKQYRMDITSSISKSITLDMVSKRKHREQSVFLHRLVFLSNPFAQRKSGPDYETRANTRLQRELWEYSYTGRVSAALIEKSHLGGTVMEACETSLADLIEKKCHDSAMAAELLLKAGVMALFAGAKRLLPVVAEAVNEDHSFVSLTNAVKTLSFLRGIEHILRIEQMDRIQDIETRALQRIVLMIATLTAADEKEDFALAESLKMLYQIVLLQGGSLYEDFKEAVCDLTAAKKAPPSAQGAAIGLLYSCGALLLDDVLAHANAYFASAGESLMRSGRFLRGLFLTAKDVVFYSEEFLRGLSGVMEALPYDDFVQLLPDLRLSFTSFSPREINDIAEQVKVVLGIEDSGQGTADLTSLPAVDESIYRIAAAADQKACELLKGVCA